MEKQEQDQTANVKAFFVFLAFCVMVIDWVFNFNTKPVVAIHLIFISIIVGVNYFKFKFNEEMQLFGNSAR
jgi:hypothetical protein